LIPPDNSVADAVLCRVAFECAKLLFLGNENAGDALAERRTLSALCEKHGTSAIAYLTDALTRVEAHSAKNVEELLPHRWVAHVIVSRLPAILAMREAWWPTEVQGQARWPEAEPLPETHGLLVASECGAVDGAQLPLRLRLG